MGRRHIQVVRNLGLELVGIFDVSQKSLELTQKEYAITDQLLFDDLDRLYSEARPECIIIATTADSHCALACIGAERGVENILVEKPMAVSLEQCDRMIETSNRFGAKLAVNHQMRFMEQYSIPKRMFAGEAYGGLTSMTVVAGNFGFSMNGSHYFEAFRYLTDDNPDEVSAWFSDEMVPNPRGPQFQDRAGSIRAVTASGKRLYMDIGADQGHGIRVVYGGRNGAVTVNELSGELLSEVREEQYRDLPTTRYGMPSVATRLNIQPSELFDSSAAVLMALLNDVNCPSGEDGRQVIALMVAAYESAEQGGIPVRMDGSFDRSRVFPWA
jgi:predicted dehydrogenase